MNTNHHSLTLDPTKRLGRAGVEVARSAVDPDSLIHRPRDLSPELAACLAACKARLIAFLRDGYEPAGDARDVFLERLAVADELGLLTHKGSPAWLIAVGEALGSEPQGLQPSAASLQAAADAGVPPRSQSLVALALDIFPGSTIAKVQRRAPGQSLEAWK